MGESSCSGKRPSGPAGPMTSCCCRLQIKMLSERKAELERRVHAALEDNELLQNTVDHLRERTLLLERRCQEKDLQVGGAAVITSHILEECSPPPDLLTCPLSSSCGRASWSCRRCRRPTAS